MIESDPSSSKVRAARRETTLCGVLLAGAAVVVFLASRGTFNSMMLFPHIFAGIVSVIALLTLLTARGVFWKVRASLVVAVILVAVAGPVVHQRAFTRSLQIREQHALEVLADRAAPEIPFLKAFHFDAAQTSPLRFGEQKRVTLVNFWSTSCSACVSEFPELKKFWSEHREAGIDVIGVTRLYDTGDDPQVEIEHIQEFLDYYDLQYPALVAAGDSTAHRAYRVNSLPSSVLIDRDGVVVAYGAGVSGTARLLDQARELLGGSDPG